MMSSSPPPNHSSGINQYAPNNTTANYTLISSPSYNEELNLQLQNLETIMHASESTSNYTTTDATFPNNSTTSDNSVVLDNKTHNLSNEMKDEVNPRAHVDQNLIMTPQYNHANESEFEDFVPISTNMDPNLQFPASSSSYMQLNHSISTTSSFNSHYYSQSASNNSISSSNVHQTPQQISRKISANALHNLANSPSLTPVRPNIVTPRVVGPNGMVYTHRRSKSKMALEKSPATGNPFYNPPSFLSPKIAKKSHRKNISISNSISLNHLDTDLNIQQLHQYDNIGSPRDTPLRTPGRSLGAGNESYIYENDDEDENDQIHHDNNFDMTLTHEYQSHNITDKNKRKLVAGSRSSNDCTVDTSANESTFITPAILTKNKFGDKLLQTSNDLNRVLTENNADAPNENTHLSVLDTISNNYSQMNYLDDLFTVDPSTVESLTKDFFTFPSNSKDLSNSYYDSIDQIPSQKLKYQYTKPKSDESIHVAATPMGYTKSISVPQTRIGSVSGESKIQRSKSSFNLNNIAIAREGKPPPSAQVEQAGGLYQSNQYGYQKSKNLHIYQEGNELSSAQYSIYDKRLYGQSTNPSRASNTTLSQLPTSGRLLTSTSLQEVAEKNSTPLNSALPINSEVPNSDDKLYPAVPISNFDQVNLDSLPSTSMKTRLKSKRTVFALSDIKHPEKLDLPQQSARSKSRSKKTVNDDKKIHECPLCHMKFQRPEHVKRHMLSHSSEKPFKCPEPNCGKRFNRNDNLKQHLRNIHKKQI